MKKLSLALAFIIISLAAFSALIQPANAQVPTPPPGEAGGISPRNQAYADPLNKDETALPLSEEVRPYVSEPGTPQVPAEPQRDTPDAEYYQDMVFQSYRDNTWEVYLAPNYHPDPYTILRVTNNAAYDGEPQLNPGSTRIVFRSDRDGNDEIYTMDPDGANVFRLTWDDNDDYNPTWSPDGTEIAFVSRRDGNSEIYSIQADGTGLQRLTNAAEQDFSPVYSPDGTNIAWIRVIDSQHGAIMIANRDGSNWYNIGTPLRFLSDLGWSPTGTRLFFDYDSDDNGWNEIGTLNVDGSNLVNVFNPGAEYDAIAGSLSISEQFLYVTRIDYILYKGKYYIESVDTLRYLMYMAGYQTVFAYQLDFYVNVAMNDITIPTSEVLRLPFYSRASGFTPSWTATDPGQAGVHATEFQYRYGTSGDWTDLQTIVSHYPQELTFSGEAGQTVYFRSRAEDEAQHWEAWPEGNGDASTTLFTWFLTGSLTDNRGHPLPGLPVNLTPAAIESLVTNNSGAYHAYLVNTGEHSLTAQHAGYGTLPVSTLNISHDTPFNTYLPPVTNWLDNGGFENQSDPFQSWYSNGLSPATGAGHSGSASAQLGLDCDMPCLDSPTSLLDDISAINGAPTILADQAGNLHILFDNRRYIMRNSSGAWSAPMVIGSLGDPGNVSFRPALAVGADGTLHAVVAGGDLHKLYYYQKPAGGAWGGQYELPNAFLRPVTIAVNSQGTVLIVYTDFGTTFYVRRLSSGAWSEPVSFGGLIDSASLIAYPDDTFKLLMSSGEGACAYTFQSDGVLIEGTDWCWEKGSQYLQLVAGADGSLHALGMYGTDYFSREWYYAYQNPSGNLSTPILLPGVPAEASMTVDPAGTVHILGMDDADTPYPVYYYSKETQENGFSKVYAFNGSYSGNIYLTSNSNGALYATYSDWFTLKFVEQQTWPIADPTTLFTGLVLPAGTHHPTLSFMYEIDSMAGAEPYFELSVTSHITTPVSTVVFSATQATPWTQAWVNLEPWDGITVTVEFSLDAPQGSSLVLARVDSISIGEWWTPVISQVTPTHFDFGEGGVLTISGDNLPLTPTVWLDDIPLLDVTYVDEHTLQATIPPSIPVGLYTLYVFSAEEQVAAAAEQVEIGYCFFLPAIVNEGQ